MPWPLQVPHFAQTDVLKVPWNDNGDVSMGLFVPVPPSAFTAAFSYSHLSNAVTPKLAQNWQKNGTPNLWKVFGSKGFWNPNEEVWYTDFLDLY